MQRYEKELKRQRGRGGKVKGGRKKANDISSLPIIYLQIICNKGAKADCFRSFIEYLERKDLFVRILGANIDIFDVAALYPLRSFIGANVHRIELHVITIG